MLNGNDLARYAISKLGVPYFYGAKMQKLSEAFMESMHKAYPKTVTTLYMAKARKKGMVGKVCCDCSGLIGAYRKKQIGSAQLYQTASKRLNISQINAFPIGTVLWKEGHVGVYIGDGYCVEEKGIDYGCVKTKVSATKWKYGLLFDDLDYNFELKSTSKKPNPYNEPKGLVSRKSNSSKADVKWVQIELKEAGYTLDIDGVFGSKTEKAVKAFQKSCKITADGVVGNVTKKYLKAN